LGISNQPAIIQRDASPTTYEEISMTYEMRTLSDAEVDQVAGGIIAILIGLAVGETVPGGAARRVSEGDDQ
jgi:hypothetical protein